MSSGMIATLRPGQKKSQPIFYPLLLWPRRLTRPLARPKVSQRVRRPAVGRVCGSGDPHTTETDPNSYSCNHIARNISPKAMQFVVACRRIEVQIDWLISKT